MKLVVLVTSKHCLLVFLSFQLNKRTKQKNPFSSNFFYRTSRQISPKGVPLQIISPKGVVFKNLTWGVVLYVICMGCSANRHMQWRLCSVNLTWPANRQWYWQLRRSANRQFVWRVRSQVSKSPVWLAVLLLQVSSFTFQREAAFPEGTFFR